MASEKAYVLPESVAGSGEGLHFGGFPGVWFPGRPIALSELGFESEAEADAARDEFASVLVDETVEKGSAPMPEQPNRRLSERQAAEAAEAESRPKARKPDKPADEATAEPAAVEGAE